MIELTYFTGKDCGVCQVLKPKIKEAITIAFTDKVLFREVDIAEEKEEAAQNLVFTLPVIIVKKDGKEVKRFVRSFGVNQVILFLERFISPAA